MRMRGIVGLSSASFGLIALGLFSAGTLEAQQDGSRLSIVEAARYALENDPKIALQVAEAEFGAGIAQEQQGVFDTVLDGTLSYEYREQELRQGRRRLERQRRQFLEDAIAAEQEELAGLQTLLTDLGSALTCDVSTCTATGCSVTTLSDPELNSQLAILDASIAATTDNAARMTLCEARATFLNSSQQIAQTGIDDLTTSVDENVAALQQLGEVPGDEIFYEWRLDAKVTKPTRSGAVFETFLESSMTGEDFKDKPKSRDLGGRGVEDLYIFRVGIGGVFPLLRGRGRDATGAAEAASKIERDAALKLVRHQSAISVLSTTLAYWDLRAAQEIAEVAERSLELQNRLVELTEGQIERGWLAGVELARVQASRARSEARLEDALRQRHQAQVNLASAMGATAEPEPGSLPWAADPFPVVPETFALERHADDWIGRARALRQDLAAARLLEESGEALRVGAESDSRSLLNASARIWLTALGETSIADTVDRWVGPSYHLQLDYEKPIGNRLRRGRLAQSEALLAQRATDAAELDRQVALSIVRSLHSLTRAGERARQTGSAVVLYDRTIDAEIRRYEQRSVGSSLIDTIQTEEQQIGARSEWILAKQEYAKILAQLQFDLGTIVTHGEDTTTLRKETLFELPPSADLPLR